MFEGYEPVAGSYSGSTPITQSLLTPWVLSKTISYQSPLIARFGDVPNTFEWPRRQL